MSLKNDPRFTQALEAHPDALGYLVSFALIKFRPARRMPEGTPIDIVFDSAYSVVECFYDDAFDAVRDDLGPDEIDALRAITDLAEPQDLIRTAFELGFIDQAMKCQEALRRAQEK